jgi:hypothetical protein
MHLCYCVVLLVVRLSWLTRGGQNRGDQVPFAILPSVVSTMSGRLYHHPYFSSSRPLLLIYELNLPVEVVTFESMADLKSPEFLKLHPQGKVQHNSL